MAKKQDYKEEILILRNHLDNLDLEAHSSQGIGDCPFCYKQGHFFINKNKFLWDCKKCGESGNLNKLVYHLGIQNKFEDINVRETNLEAVEIISLNKGTHVGEDEELEVNV